MSHWQPIETAPKDGTLILVWFKTRPGLNGASGYCRSSRFTKSKTQTGNSYDAWVDEDDYSLLAYHEPTHWMPYINPHAL